MTESLLRVRDLCAGYGASQVLDEISFSVDTEAVGIIGRDGMGKTTLCATLMGLVQPSAGTITYRGERIDGRSPERIARAGIFYVGQGRRLFPSLTVDEHLRMPAKGTPCRRWTPKAVHELFPRLADRRQRAGGNLSDGEQQMLAVGARCCSTGPCC